MTPYGRTFLKISMISIATWPPCGRWPHAPRPPPLPTVGIVAPPPSNRAGKKRAGDQHDDLGSGAHGAQGDPATGYTDVFLMKNARSRFTQQLEGAGFQVL